MKSEAAAPAAPKARNPKAEPVTFSPYIVRRHREQLAEWIKANGIDPHDIPLTYPIRVEEGKSGPAIRYQAYARTEDSKLLLDPDDEDQAVTEERTTPCTVPPPDLTTRPAQPEPEPEADE